MYAATIRFVLPPETDWDAVRQLLQQRAHLYTDMPGLISKAFLFDPETQEYGGNYVWKTREALDAFLASDVFKNAVDRFGVPAVRIHEIAAYLDRGEVVLPPVVAVADLS